MPVSVEVPATEPAVAVKEAELDAAGIMTEAGAVITLLLFERETEAPPAAAGALSVAVQVLEPPAAIEIGLQLSDDRVTAVGALTVTVADVDVPFKEAVIVLV